MKEEIKEEENEILDTINKIKKENTEEYLSSVEEFSIILKIIKDYSSLNREQKAIGLELFLESIKVNTGKVLIELRPEIRDLLNLTSFSLTRTSEKPLPKRDNGSEKLDFNLWYTR